MFVRLGRLPESTGSYWGYSICSALLGGILLILSLQYAVADPVILINGAGSEIDPTLMDCSQRTPEYDSETGLTTYRCKPVTKDVVEKIYVEDTVNLTEANSTITEKMIEQIYLEDDQDYVKYEVMKSESPKKMRENRKLKNIRSKNYHLYERMVSDVPIEDNTISKMSQNYINSGIVQSKQKFRIKNRCAPGEVYASEIDLCLPHKRKNKNLNSDNQHQTDLFNANRKHHKKNKNKLLKVIKHDIKNRCSIGEIYVSELDICLQNDYKLLKVRKSDVKKHCSPGELYIPELGICLPHEYKRKHSNIRNQPQADIFTMSSKHHNRKSKIPTKVGKFKGKSRCGNKEVYISELDICLNPNEISQSYVHDQPQDATTTLKTDNHMSYMKKPLSVEVFHGKSRCGSEEHYISELDICVPFENNENGFGKIYHQPQSGSLTLEPYNPKADTQKVLKVSKFEGRSRCGSREVYLSELDICIPYDNKLVQLSLLAQGDLSKDNIKEFNEREMYEYNS